MEKVRYFGMFDAEGYPVAFYPSDIHPVPPDGSVEISQEQWAALLVSQGNLTFVNGKLTDTPLPPPAPEKILASLPSVSHAQIITALIMSEIITEAEGVAWITGTLPAAVEAMIATLPADQRVIARLRAIRPSSVVPTDPLVAALTAAQGQGVADLIALFQTAAAL